MKYQELKQCGNERGHGIEVKVQNKGKPRQELGDRNQSRELAGMMLTYWLVQVVFFYIT